MADATGKKLLALLQPKQPVELRSAAIQVLGEIGPRDPEVTKAICAALEDADATVRSQAMIAAGKLQISQALPALLDRLTAGGPESEVAAQAAARMGAKGTQALRDLMHEVAPGLRRRIAAALGGAGTERAETAALDTLLDTDPGVVDAAVRSLTQEVPTLTSQHRKRMADHALDLLKPKKGAALPVVSEIALVRLLGALGDPRGEAVFWPRLEPNHAVEVRAAALQGLGALHVNPPRDKLKRLLACAADGDFRVAAPALMLLRPLEVADKAASDWLGLFAAPDPAVRRFAIEKLAERDTPEVSQALLDQIHYPDSGLRTEALHRLIRLEHGREALAQALLEADTPDDAWALARAQMAIAREHPAKLRTQLFARACEYLVENDRRADALLAVLREADARGLRDQIEERAQAMRSKKKYETALTYLRLLTRDPACAESVRFEVAACGLKLSSHDLAAEARAADQSLQQFARLVHNPETPPIERLKQAKWLEPEDLFYLGFHFVEGERREKEFGGQVLHLLVERSPRSKLAKDAKSKLRSAGLE